jgi:hypothetical protein
VKDGTEALNEEQLDRLARYFDEEVISAQYYKIPRAKIQRPAIG